MNDDKQDDDWKGLNKLRGIKASRFDERSYKIKQAKLKKEREREKEEKK